MKTKRCKVQEILLQNGSMKIFTSEKSRKLFQRKAVISNQSGKNQKDEEDAQKFSQYFDWQEPLNRTPSPILAMLRAERFCKGFGFSRKRSFRNHGNAVIKSQNDCAQQIALAITDAYKRLLNDICETLQGSERKADRCD